MATKKFELDVPLMLKLEEERREAQALASELQAERNSKSKMIGMMKGKGEDTTAIMAEVDGLKAKTVEAEERMKAADKSIEDYLLQIPNAPHESSPVGADEGENVEVLKWGTVPQFDFEIKDHVDIGEGINGEDRQGERGREAEGNRERERERERESIHATATAAAARTSTY